MVPLSTECLASLGFARLASLRFVLEALVSKKELLAGREDELCAAVNALKNPVPVFHGFPLTLAQNLHHRRRPLLPLAA